MRINNLSTLVAVVILAGCSNEPQNYDDCILQHVKAGMSELAVAQLIEACERKYSLQPEAEQESVDIPKSEGSLITGRMAITDSGHASGTVYNKSFTWHVTEIHIDILDEDWKSKMRDDEKFHVERYRIPIDIPPLTTQTFFVRVNWPSDKEYSWRFSEEMKGYQTTVEASDEATN